MAPHELLSNKQLYFEHCNILEFFFSKQCTFNLRITLQTQFEVKAHNSLKLYREL